MKRIRDASLSDAGRILEIYDYYVVNTAISFEWVTPSIDEFRERMRHTMERYPYLVILDEDRIEGYAYAGVFKGRAAYDWSCEVSIYVDHNARKCGLGRMLYEAMEERLRGMGILNLYACIAYPETEDEYLTGNSAGFHAHLGYELAGKFRRCAYKFGRWYHMIWMEKFIGDHRDQQPPVSKYVYGKESTVRYSS